MLQNKDIKKIEELNDFFTSDEKVGDTFIDMLKVFRCRALTRFIGEIKKRGYSSGELLSVLLLLPFIGVNSVRAMLYSGLAWFSEAEKDAYYRLKNKVTIKWRQLLWIVAKRFKQLVKEKGEFSGVRCLILDDSLLMKTTRFTEGISKVFDHVTKLHVWGYKMLLLGWWDGKSFLPLDFSFHREKGSNKKKPFGMSKTQKKEQYSKEREKHTPAYKRKKELDTSKIKQALKLLRRAFKHGFISDYILTDSWFFCLELLQMVQAFEKATVHLIAMARMGKAKYEYNGIRYSPLELKQHLKGHKKRSRKLKATYIECYACYQDIPVKMFFYPLYGTKKVEAYSNHRLISTFYPNHGDI